MSRLDFTAMALNERLVAAGRLAEFDSAVAADDRPALLTLLREIDVARTHETADALLGARRSRPI